MWRMIHIMAASSLAHSLTDLDAEEKKKKIGADHSHNGLCIEIQSLKRQFNVVARRYQ